MNRRANQPFRTNSILLSSAAIALIAALAPRAARAADPGKDLPAAEKDKIEKLIVHVTSLDAKFVRNGEEYDAATAAKLMRYKWEKNADKIHTARDFIEQAASKSIHSGESYHIKFKDGKEADSGPYLSEQLDKLEGKTAATKGS